MDRRSRPTEPQRPIAVPRTKTSDRRTVSTDADCYSMILFGERNAAGSKNEVTISIADRNLRTTSTAIINLRSARALYDYLGDFLRERDNE